MKKSIVAALMLAGLFSAQAQAAVRTGVPSYDLDTVKSITFTEAPAASFYELITSTTVVLTFTRSAFGSVFTLWDDLDASVGNLEFFNPNDGQITINASNPTATLTLGPGSYALRLSAAATNAGITVANVPVPAAAWLFGSALFGAGALRRKQKVATAV